MSKPTIFEIVSNHRVQLLKNLLIKDLAILVDEYVKYDYIDVLTCVIMENICVPGPQYLKEDFALKLFYAIKNIINKQHQDLLVDKEYLRCGEKYRWSPWRSLDTTMAIEKLLMKWNGSSALKGIRDKLEAILNPTVCGKINYKGIKWPTDKQMLLYFPQSDPNYSIDDDSSSSVSVSVSGTFSASDDDDSSSDIIGGLGCDWSDSYDGSASDTDSD